MTDEQLDQLIADDDLGLLKIKPKRTPQTTEEEKLLAGFHEILRFVEANEVAPSEHGEELSERLLFARLQAIKRDASQREMLRKFDEYGLLSVEDQSFPETIDEVLDDEFLDSLSQEGSEILTIKNIPLAKDIESPDYVAQRKPCKNFHLYEDQLRQCQEEIRLGRRSLLPFANESQIEAGMFYVLRGVLVLVTEVGERIKKNGKWNARCRCIFENGTESDMLSRSLARELYKDGRRVTELADRLLNPMVVTNDDKATGYVYVLRSLSDNDDIKSMPNLYKIGLSRRSVESRIRNAHMEATYLMASVAVVSTFQCYNVNLPKLEKLIHRFFEPALVDVQVTDLNGNYVTPKEWFSVPLPCITAAIRLLISGEILKFRYDPRAEEIVPHSN
jgi:hypothetical protein